MAELIRSPRGTQDILPDEEKYWQFLQDTFKRKCEAFSCERIILPVFEQKRLFVRTIGEVTDIVEKEMYAVNRTSTRGELPDKKEPAEELVLVPEYTAGAARAYVQNGMFNYPQPVKLYYFGPAFRYDRPQAGRFRIFYQYGVEVFGNSDPSTDAAVIFLAWQIPKSLKISQKLIVDINSVGCDECRAKMRKKFTSYLEMYKDNLCLDCQRRFLINPLRILDCKEKKCQLIVKNAPQLIDNLCSDCKNHLKEVLEYLDASEIPYNLDPTMIRGLDYYTRTVFEIREQKDKSRQGTVIAGGRYDNLIESIGGRPTPSVGFAGGAERTIELIKREKVEIAEKIKADICVIQLGQNARKKSFQLINQLNDWGYEAVSVLGKDSLKSQLKTANRMKIPVALIMGQREVFDNTVIYKDMEEGEQETIDLKDLKKVLEQRLPDKS